MGQISTWEKSIFEKSWIFICSYGTWSEVNSCQIRPLNALQLFRNPAMTFRLEGKRWRKQREQRDLRRIPFLLHTRTFLPEKPSIVTSLASNHLILDGDYLISLSIYLSIYLCLFLPLDLFNANSPGQGIHGGADKVHPVHKHSQLNTTSEIFKK